MVDFPLLLASMFDYQRLMMGLLIIYRSFVGELIEIIVEWYHLLMTSKKINHRPYVDDLYHPFMVNMRMYYYCFNMNGYYHVLAINNLITLMFFTIVLHHCFPNKKVVF